MDREFVQGYKVECEGAESRNTGAYDVVPNRHHIFGKESRFRVVVDEQIDGKKVGNDKKDLDECGKLSGQSSCEVVRR